MDVLATCGGPIILGRTGENDYTVVVFPFDGPAGASVALFNRLPGSTSSYPVAAVEVQNSTVRWTVSSADLSANGYGECEITYTLGDVVAKSVRYPTQVIASLDGQGDPPEGWDTWQAVFTALKAQAEAAAQTATDAAQTAESASEAIQNLSVSSTTLTPGSAATVEKTVDPETGAVSLAFGIPEGQQGGKGDTGKTPDISIGTVTTGDAGSDASATMTGTPENPVLNLTIPRGNAGKDGEPGKDGKDGEDYVLTAADKAEIAQQAEELLAPALDNKAPIIINSASGDIAHFTDGADGLPVKELTVNVEPVQSGSGDPSPDNVRPISGWTGAKVTRTGKNLLKNGIIPSANLSPYTFANAQFFKSGSYTLSFQSTTATSWRYFARGFDSNGNTLSDGFMTAGGMTYRSEYNGYLSGGNTTNAFINIVLKKDCYVVFGLMLGDVTAQTMITGAMLELGSTATSYEPYQGDTYDITFPSEAGTVYGGTLDVTNGVLTVDRSQIASYAGETLPSTWISDRDVYSAGATPTTGAQVVYELATPITYTLTPQEIRTLLGTNNVWADTGDTSVSYRADTKLFVEQNAPESPVQDVQVDGTSVVTDGVANVPVATSNAPGVVKASPTSINAYGVGIGADGILRITVPTDSQVKSGTMGNAPLSPSKQHLATFYGLAKAAGSDEKNSTLPLGQYTEAAKSAISQMLNAPESVPGTTPTITALAGVQYVCGEVSTLDITPPASGCVDVRFESGSTATVLTITPPSGVTVKWAGGFDPTSLDANTTYEINIADGLGVAASWT